MLLLNRKVTFSSPFELPTDLFVSFSNIMRDQNRLMSPDDESNNPENTVIVDHSEQSSRVSRAFFTLKNPILIPSLFGSFGVLCVCLILFRTHVYRLCIVVFYGHGFFQRRSNSSKLRAQSKQQRSYYSLSSLSKP